MSKQPDKDYRNRVYRLVRRIPRGRVTTYGQIAEILGEGYTPRTVGFVMHGSGDETPWHRVINSRGGCSTGRLVLPHDKQQRMLEAEGVTFDNRGRCDLQTYLWIPPQKNNVRDLPATGHTLLKKKSGRKTNESRSTRQKSALRR